VTIRAFKSSPPLKGFDMVGVGGLVPPAVAKETTGRTTRIDNKLQNAIFLNIFILF
jgi:hypothetical protein